MFPHEQLVAVRESYLDGLHAAWALAIAFAGVAILTGLTLGFKRIEKPGRGKTIVAEPMLEKMKAEATMVHED